MTRSAPTTPVSSGGGAQLPPVRPQTPRDVAPAKRRAAARRYFAASGLHLLLAAMAFILVLPFTWMILTSFKHLSQVNDPSWIPAAPSALKPGDLADPLAVIQRLRDADAPLTKHLRTLMRPSVLAEVDAFDVAAVTADAPFPEAMRNSLTSEFNRVIAETTVFDVDAFAGVEPGEQTIKLRDRLPLMAQELADARMAYDAALAKSQDMHSLPAAVRQLQRDAARANARVKDLDERHRHARALLNRRHLDDAFATSGGGAIRPTHALQWENFIQVFYDIPFARYYWNSLFVAAWVTFLQCFTSSLAAFSFARINWPGRDKVFLLYLSTMMLPGLVMMIPNYQIMISLGLVNTMIGLILPAAFSAFGTFLLRQFMLSIPSSLDEAAEIDGASKWRLYWDIILPLSRPGLITLAIFTFMGNYNAFFWPLVMLKSQHKYTLPIGLLYFDSSAGQVTNLLMAAVAMSVVPMIVVFITLQKYLVKGIQLGAVKG